MSNTDSLISSERYAATRLRIEHASPMPRDVDINMLVVANPVANPAQLLTFA